MRKCPRGNTLYPKMHYKGGSYYRVHQNKWHKLGSDYAKAVIALHQTQAAGDQWAKLVDLTYQDFGELAKNTQEQYRLVKPKILHGFGAFEPHEITAGDIGQFMHLYAETPHLANRMLSVLRRVFAKGLYLGACDTNPAKFINRFREAPRTRYLLDTEYAAIYRHANEVTQIVMDLCYLTGQRIGDVLKIRRQDITDQGIEIVQQKTGAKLTVQMTDNLEEVVLRAKRLRSVPCQWLLHPKGKATPYAYASVRDGFRRAYTKAGVKDVCLHDLRAKSLTDLKDAGGNPQALAGHKTEATTVRYLRSIAIPLVAGPSKVRLE